MPDRDPSPPHVRVRTAVRRCIDDLGVENPPLVLVACSGGPDSVALAVAARAEHPRVGAVVVDHGLREESAVEAERTGEWLRAAGLDPVVVRTVRVDAAGTGVEAGARRARYAALDDAAAELAAAAILLGHTRDDQAETVLLGLARGSGTRSLAGMPRDRGIYRRPLLDLPRDVVRAAVPDGTPLVDDPHNADDRYARARVRHHVLPLLESELGPGIGDALARTADLARADADLLDLLAAEESRLLEHDGELDAEGLAARHPALVSRAVRSWLVGQGVRPGALGAEHVGRVVDLVTGWRGQGAVALPGGVEAVRECGRLRVRPAPSSLES